MRPFALRQDEPPARALRVVPEGPEGPPAAGARGLPPDALVRFGDFLTCDAATRAMLETLLRVARSEAPVLLAGETGTGKELLARALHEHGGREGALVAQNCAAIPDALLEAELFGHAAGAFTGAQRAREGLLAAADRGTLFLDEAGEMPVAMQAKLLRALEQGEVRALGESRARRVRVRLVAATHRDLEREVAAGRFREDLYYRLKVVEVAIPPLRSRRDDVLPLARHFLGQCALRERKALGGFDAGALQALRAHDWPGNARELRHRVWRAVALALPGAVIDAASLGLAGVSPRRVERAGRAAGEAAPGDGPGRGEPEVAAELAVGRIPLPQALERFERRMIEEALRRSGGNRTRAARLLGGVGRTALLAKMKRLQIG